MILIYLNGELWSSTTLAIDQPESKSERKLQRKGKIPKEESLDIKALCQILLKTFNSKNITQMPKSRGPRVEEERKITCRAFTLEIILR